MQWYEVTYDIHPDGSTEYKVHSYRWEDDELVDQEITYMAVVKGVRYYSVTLEAESPGDAVMRGAELSPNFIDLSFNAWGEEDSGEALDQSAGGTSDLRVAEAGGD